MQARALTELQAPHRHRHTQWLLFPPYQMLLFPPYHFPPIRCSCFLPIRCSGGCLIVTSPVVYK